MDKSIGIILLPDQNTRREIGGGSDVIFLPHEKGTIVNHWLG
jgi:hypothetical protein